MLLLSDVQLKVEQKIRVKRILLAFNQTYIVVHNEEQHKTVDRMRITTTFLHLDKDSHFIKKYSFKCFNQFVMPNDETLVFVDYSQLCLATLNIKTDLLKYKQIRITQNDKYIQLFYFPESNWVCVKAEEQSKTSNQYFYSDRNFLKSNIKLLYFDCEQIKSGQLITSHEHIFQQDIQLHDENARKGDFHSLVIFRNKESSQVFLYSIQKHHRSLTCQKRIINLHWLNMLAPQIQINVHIWKINQEQILIVSQQSQVNTIWIFEINNLKAKNMNNSLKTKQCYRKIVFLKDFVFMSQTNFCNGPYFQQGYMYSVNISSGELQIKENIHYLLPCEYRTCDYNQQILIEQLPTNRIRKLKMVLDRQKYMQMLEHINEDFDDDLLMDALNLLDCI